MNATDPSFANILQTQGTIEHYHVPKYQREYTWGRNEWEQLLNDINENEAGYFMGSVICIDDNPELGPGASRIYEVVDGQQRLTTITLMLMAIYSSFLNLQKEIEDEDDDESFDEFKLTLSSIRKQLVHKKNKVNHTERNYFRDKDNKYCFLRVKPSTQKANEADYLHILDELKLIKGKFSSKFCGLRRIYKAYDYFRKEIPQTYEGLSSLYHKINSLKFIHISVSSSSDAFTLFESLNNRGIPLSVMDIIKNKMLANLESQHKIDIDKAYEDWQELLKFLPEYHDQERFLRHYYNAFKVYPEKRIEKYTRATKSNLIKIFEQYIKKSAKGIFEDLLLKAAEYNRFIEPESCDDTTQAALLIDLRRIGSAPSYLLLLYLYSLEENKYENKLGTLNNVLKFLVKYYVRRNITDFPNTRDLDAINIEVIEHCQRAIDQGGKITSDMIIEALLKGKGKTADLSNFQQNLSDNLFYHNSGMARYVLAKLDEASHSREYKPDLWARNDKGLLVWTVEHILPQGQNIPECWVSMAGSGEKQKAKDVHEKWVHCLGNLTLSGYNSKLSNACFNEKQDLHENKRFLGNRINIGYKNRLFLNDLEFPYKESRTSLADIPEWNKESIESRNNAMVDMLIKLFAFDEHELKEFQNGGQKKIELNEVSA